MIGDPHAKKTKKNIIFSSILVLVCATVLGLLFQNCGSGFQALQSSDQLAQLGSVAPGPSLASGGVDPALTKMGEVSYGLFNKITIANGIVAEGQLGKAMLVRGDSKTYVYVTALGLVPSQTYNSHVHADTCANGGGGHYKKDPTITASDPNNEIWLTLNTDAQGTAFARAEVPYVAGPNAVSIVVHNLDSSKFYCADLSLQQSAASAVSQWSGSSFQLMSTTKAGVMIAGNATKVVLANHMSGFHVTVWGLTPGAVYPVHVHAANCASGGGGHFQIDSTAAAGQANEIWMPLNASATGSAYSEVWVNQVTSTTQAGALSIVIHDPVDATKQACADLIPIPSPVSISGLFQLTDTAVDKAFVLSNLNPAALSGAGYQYSTDLTAAPATSVQVGTFGLNPLTYQAHVHNLPCRLGAGSHYKFDTSQTASSATNEVWFTLNVDGTTKIGTSSVNAATVLRADAMSVVVHDPADNSKLLCADLL